MKKLKGVALEQHRDNECRKQLPPLDLRGQREKMALSELRKSKKIPAELGPRHTWGGEGAA